MATRSAVAKPTPAALLRTCIERFGPEDQRFIRSVRAAVRKRFPTANELVYDYRKFFVLSYTPTDHPLDAIVALAARPDGVRLYLMNGPKLKDPKKLLQGSGKDTRFLQVDTVRKLAHPDVKALIAAAVDLARVPVAAAGRGKLLDPTAAAKDRARKKRAT